MKLNLLVSFGFTPVAKQIPLNLLLKISFESMIPPKIEK